MDNIGQWDNIEAALEKIFKSDKYSDYELLAKIRSGEAVLVGDFSAFMDQRNELRSQVSALQAENEVLREFKRIVANKCRGFRAHVHSGKHTTADIHKFINAIMSASNDIDSLSGGDA